MQYRTSPAQIPPGLSGKPLQDWLQEQVEVRAKAEAEAEKELEKLTEIIPSIDQPIIEETNQPPVEKPGITKYLDAQVEQPTPPQLPIGPEPLFSGGFENSQIHYRKIEGSFPDSDEELSDKIKSLWEESSCLNDQQIYEIEFHATRMLKGYFGPDHLEAALSFTERYLTDCIDPDLVESNWDLVRTPSWELECAYYLSSNGFDHEDLKLSLRHGRNRRLAHMAQMIQRHNPGSWFRMNQEMLAKLMECSQQNISKSLDLLVRIGWLKRQKIPTTLTTGMKVSTCEYQCIYAS